MKTVAFAAEVLTPSLSTGDIVIRRSKVFETGDYPDKGFSLDETEARTAVASFAPVNADLEHRNTILDGKLGGLIGIEMGEDGKTLYGTIAEPKWFNDVLGEPTPEKPRKYSLTWTKDGKQIAGIAHVLNPRVKDAAVFNAYADFSGDAQFRYESESERDNIPEEDFGDPANQLFPARTQDEFRDSMRELANAEDPTSVKARLIAIGERKGFKTESPVYWPTTGISRKLGEDCLSCYSLENPNMKFFTQPSAGNFKPATADELVTFTGGTVSSQIENVFVQETEGGQIRRASAEQIVAATAGRVKFAVSESAPAISPEIQAQLDRLAKFEAAEAATANAAFTATAEAQYEALLKDNKAKPAHKAPIIAAFTIAARYDAERKELAYFSDDAPEAKFSMLDHLKGLHENVMPHQLTTEVATSFSDGSMAMFDSTKTTFTNSEGKKQTLAEQLFDRAEKEKAATATATA